MYWGMDSQRNSLLRRILLALGLRSDEVAAGHGSLPQVESRPSTQSRKRSKDHQRERSGDGSAEKAAEAISEAAEALDTQIRDSIESSETGGSSEEMVQRARERWSSD